VTDSDSSPFRQFRFTRPPGGTSILLVRHGESVPAVPGQPFSLVDGHGDPELHPHGVAQAQRVADRLVHGYAGEPIQALYVTTLKRTSQTAAPLADRLGLEPMVEADLREVYLGDWEGGLYRIKMVEGDPISQKMFKEERWDVIPGAEPEADFTSRVVAGIERIASKHPDQLVALFTHGGVIGRIISIATGARPFAFGAANASMSLLVVGDGRWMIRSFNDTAHLDGLDG
jgi:probable phosphoglycerate mutase